MIAWGAVETAIATVTCTEVLTAITAIAAFYAAQKTADMIANSVDQNVYAEEKKEEKPPYCGEKLGDDPTKCPGEGFEWRGSGDPETGRGSWVKDHRLPT